MVSINNSSFEFFFCRGQLFSATSLQKKLIDVLTCLWLMCAQCLKFDFDIYSFISKLSDKEGCCFVRPVFSATAVWLGGLAVMNL